MTYSQINPAEAGGFSRREEKTMQIGQLKIGDFCG
jgi:hypothetical protein